MYLDQQEIEELEKLLRRCLQWSEAPALAWSVKAFERETASSYLACRPYLMYPFGFDEARTILRTDPTGRSYLSRFLEDAGSNKGAFYAAGLTAEAVLRSKTDGSWWVISDIHGDPNREVDEHGAFFDSEVQIGLLNRSGDSKRITGTEFIQRLSKSQIEVPSSEKWYFSGIWVPPEVNRGAVLASSFSTDLFSSLKSGELTVSDLGWQDLEDLVAELLRRKGLQVTQTKRTQDGGRDLIAVGEWFPGQEWELAVEVTSSPVVGIAKLSKALYQNRHYPATMLATSGRFSAGVYSEQGLQDNSLRLILADGDHLSKWIAGS